MAELSKLTSARWARVAVTAALLGGAVFFFREQLGFISQGVGAVRTASPLWVGISVLVCALSFLAMGEVMAVLMAAGGVKVGRGQALALVLAANAVSSSLPGGPALSTVLQYKVQRAWGASVMVIGWFIVLSGALSTLWLVILGLGAVVLFGASFSVASLVAVGIGMTALAFGVYWVANNPWFLERVATATLPLVNRMLRRAPEVGMEGVVAQIRQLQSVTLPLSKLVSVTLLSLLNRVFDLLTLWAAVVAVTGVIPAMALVPNGTNIAGITLAFLTAKIIGATGVTPGGLGPLEAALTATLIAVGMQAATALAAVLVYRMVSFILATAIGWVVYLVGLKEKP
ncbi:YbhN family protein [Corynebacterium sp. H128]|uniref:lysylphosphatidylglycerol synthase transmembrane domain-containing protein n=1 Tax=unclassified Corynebacterium TaxID=2624378 RepID=UPI0030AB53BF